MLEEYAGLEEGYCILGIDVKVCSGEVSETDTTQDAAGGGRTNSGTNEH